MGNAFSREKEMITFLRHDKKNSNSDEKFSGKETQKSQSFFITNFLSLFFEEEVLKNLKQVNSEKLQVPHQ